MKKIILFTLTLFVLCSLTAFTQEGEIIEGEVTLNRNITLVVNEKEPAMAYSLALFPVFGPSASANYVSQSPLDWKVDEELGKKALRQTLLNLGTIAAGVFLDISRSDSDFGFVPLFTQIAFLASTIHNQSFGNEMAEVAVNYNKDLHIKFNWTYPQISVDF